MATKAGNGGSYDNDDDFNEEEIYDQFPKTDHGEDHGPGFNEQVRLNDENLFTDEARRNPVIRAFLEAPFSVTYAQYKSSHREAEYFIHKPHKVMAGEIDGIGGRVDRFPERREDRRIVTLVLNHELTLAKHVMRTLTIEDGKVAGQMIHKEEREEDGTSL